MGAPAKSRATRADLEAVPEHLVAELIRAWMWLVDVDARLLTASRLHDHRWLEIGPWCDSDVARIEPFDAIELRLADLWGSTNPSGA